MEMVLQTVNVIAPIQPVLQVEVIQPVTITTVSMANTSTSSSSIKSVGTLSRPTGIAGMTSLGYTNGSMKPSRTFLAHFAVTLAANMTSLDRAG